MPCVRLRAVYYTRVEIDIQYWPLKQSTEDSRDRREKGTASFFLTACFFWIITEFEANGFRAHLYHIELYLELQNSGTFYLFNSVSNQAGLLRCYVFSLQSGDFRCFTVGSLL